VVFGHGTTNAHDEAAWLVLWRLGLPLDTDIDSPNAVVPHAQGVNAVMELDRRTPSARASLRPTSRGKPGCRAGVFMSTSGRLFRVR
jgi:ribosomal protein L3 glutamine methyltransferase